MPKFKGTDDERSVGRAKQPAEGPKFLRARIGAALALILFSASAASQTSTPLSTLDSRDLGNTGLISMDQALTQLPNGQIAITEYSHVQSVAVKASRMKFFLPTLTGMRDVTATSALSTPVNIRSIPMSAIDLVPVEGQTLPNVLIADGGYDEPPFLGGNNRIMIPNAQGIYVDRSADLAALGLPQTFYHGVGTGRINGQAVFAAANIGANTTATSGGPLVKPGIELVSVTPSGVMTRLTSRLPALSPDNATNRFYTAVAIGDFTGRGGDLFLGAMNPAANPSSLLLNDGNGGFTRTDLNLNQTLPAIARGVPMYGGPPYWSVMKILPIKFSGEAHQGVIVGYANTGHQSYGGTDTSGPAYYLQFLQGDGRGGFTDVTSARLPTGPPVMRNPTREGDWPRGITEFNAAGQRDLLITHQGPPIILLNDGSNRFTDSGLKLPPEMWHVVFGTIEGVDGFIATAPSDTDSGNSKIIFVPTSVVRMPFGGRAISSPITRDFHLHGPNANGAANLLQSYDTAISITVNGLCPCSATNPAPAGTFDVLVNGRKIGSGTLLGIPGGIWNGQQIIRDQKFNFTVSGLSEIETLQMVPTSGNNLYAVSASIYGTDLGANNNNRFRGDNWNTRIRQPLGTAATPLEVTGRSNRALPSTAHVLGASSAYSWSGIGTRTIRLTESSGLNQNAILNDITYVRFQDGALMDTRSGLMTNAAGTAIVPEAGWWWNDAEGGRGFSLERSQSNGALFFAAYMYETDGSPVWYVGTLNSVAPNSYAGSLVRFQGGQSLTGPYRAPTGSSIVASTQITFSSATAAALSISGPGLTPTAINVSRYPITPNGLTRPATSAQPQTGWWWNAAEGGRGYFIEVQDGTLFLASYMYDTNGRPVWFTSIGPLTDDRTYQGKLRQYGGGQTLGGRYVAPPAMTELGDIALSFTSPTAGTLTLPGAIRVPIQRYTF